MNQFLESLFEGQQYDKNSFFLIAGPCVVESEEIVYEVAEKVSAICKRLQIPYVLKASYRKANRTSANSFTGVGDEKGLAILQKVAKQFGLPCTTDIHTEKEAAMAAAYVDICFPVPANGTVNCFRRNRQNCKRKKRTVSKRCVYEVCC
jgi:2-dehydro-3-deoxyphosphooctonate aldolase (KDO 8-P synthase)